MSVGTRAAGSRWSAVERPEVVPLSFAQSRLWFIDQFQGPSPIYNIAVALRLRGHLDAGRAGCGAGRRGGPTGEPAHVVPGGGGDPAAVGGPAEQADFGWDVVDATGWSGDRLGERSTPGAARRSIWPPRFRLRARLFRVAEDENLLVAVVHHIAADGWSVAPLVTDSGWPTPAARQDGRRSKIPRSVCSSFCDQPGREHRVHADLLRTEKRAVGDGRHRDRLGHDHLVCFCHTSPLPMGRLGSGPYFVWVSTASILQMSILAMNWETRLILRLSEKLNTKIKAGPLKVLPPDDNPYADWSATLFVADRTQYVLLTNTSSLYSVVMYEQVTMLTAASSNVH